MKIVTREVSVTTRRGFTIIELMVVLALIGLVSYLSIPRVEEWIARQQARQFISQFISDFSKAVTISRINQNVGGTMTSGSAITRAAIYVNFNNPRRYYVLTRTQQGDTPVNWNPANDNVLKEVNLSGRLQIYDVNHVNSGTAVLQFTPSGQVRNVVGNPIAPSQENCGTQSSNKLYHAQVVLRADLYFSQPLFYRIEVNTLGEYRVCMSLGNNTFTETGDVEVLSL